MKPPPLHRSPVFWLGILLTLIAWLMLLSRKRKHLHLLTESESPQTPHP